MTGVTGRLGLGGSGTDWRARLRRAGAAAGSAAAARRGLRTAVVMPALLAVCLKGFGNVQMALFAAFGSFATLVFVSFEGSAREKLVSHAMLAGAGSVLLVVGTAGAAASVATVSLLTLPVTFVVFFLGITGPRVVAGGMAALLAYVLPAASPSALGMIPDRLAGWCLASLAGTAAVLVLPVPAADDRLRASLRALSESLATQLRLLLDARPGDAAAAATLEAKRALRAEFGATPYRPTGLAEREQALANAVELLEWCASLLADWTREQPDLSRAPSTQRDLVLACADVLAGAGALLSARPGEAGSSPPDLARLDQARRTSLARLDALSADDERYTERLRLSLYGHALAMAALGVGADAMVAAGLLDMRDLAESRARWFTQGVPEAPTRAETVRSYARAAAAHTSLRSVCFINSARSAVALAAAVAVADLSSVQHGFWVVLGTLSVLRTSVSATGSTALQALAGNLMGFIVGAGLLLALGTSGPALWIVLPVAVLVAAYAPGVLPFVAGQAAFTVMVAVLFNLLVPVGWKVGELRVFDVAIGCTVSVAVGLLVWPRGTSAVVARDLADAYRSGAQYLRQAIEGVCGLRQDGGTAGTKAFIAGQRLDDAIRGLLTERGSERISPEELYRLVGGSLRLRLTAHAVAALPPEPGEDERTLSQIQRRTMALVGWYDQLARQVEAHPPEALAPLRALPARVSGGEPSAQPRRMIWLQEYLDQLDAHLPALVEPATHLAEALRRPWWR